jgi:hypothetical protein
MARNLDRAYRMPVSEPPVINVDPTAPLASFENIVRDTASVEVLEGSVRDLAFRYTGILTALPVPYAMREKLGELAVDGPPSSADEYWPVFNSLFSYVEKMHLRPSIRGRLTPARLSAPAMFKNMRTLLNGTEEEKARAMKRLVSTMRNRGDSGEQSIIIGDPDMNVFIPLWVNLMAANAYGELVVNYPWKVFSSIQPLLCTPEDPMLYNTVTAMYPLTPMDDNDPLRLTMHNTVLLNMTLFSKSLVYLTSIRNSVLSKRLDAIETLFTYRLKVAATVLDLLFAQCEYCGRLCAEYRRHADKRADELRDSDLRTACINLLVLIGTYAFAALAMADVFNVYMQLFTDLIWINNLRTCMVSRVEPFARGYLDNFQHTHFDDALHEDAIFARLTATFTDHPFGDAFGLILYNHAVKPTEAPAFFQWLVRLRDVVSAQIFKPSYSIKDIRALGKIIEFTAVNMSGHLPQNKKAVEERTRTQGSIMTELSAIFRTAVPGVAPKIHKMYEEAAGTLFHQHE